MDSEKLSILLKEKENLTLEFKERYTTKVDEDIVAFANTKGGVLILGVSNDGSVIGQKLTNEIKAQVNNLARNCSPSIEVRLSEIQSVFVIEVAEGKEKPYSCGSGYFRRLDGNTQKMTHDEVRIMFGEYEQTPFEEKINKNCLLEDISTDKVKRYMNEAKITDASQNIKETLSSANVLRREQVKNAGILLFAKQVVKFIPNSRLDLIRFKGKDKVNIFDRMEVNDDLLTQFDQAMFFLKKHLNTRSEIKGVNRYDILEIPEEVLREAVVNALIHRDYSFTGTSLSVEIFDDRVEITNPGSLPKGLEASFGKVSIRRNELIADLFFRMDKVEKAGTGIQRMRDKMKEAGLPPPKFTMDSFFIVGLGRPNPQVTPQVTPQVKLTELEGNIIAEIKANPKISRNVLAKKMEISADTVKEYLKKLKSKKAIKRVGKTSGGYWEILT